MPAEHASRLRVSANSRSREPRSRLAYDRDPDQTYDCDGEQDLQNRERRRGDKRIAPFLQRAKQKAALSKLPKNSAGKKARRTRPIVQDGSLRKDEEASPAGFNDASAIGHCTRSAA